MLPQVGLQVGYGYMYGLRVDDKMMRDSGDIRLHGKKGVLYTNLPQNVHYLCNDGITIDGIKFYGLQF